MDDENKAALYRGLMMAGLGIMGSPSTPYKQTFGQRIAPGLMQGVQAMDDYTRMIQQQKFDTMKMQAFQDEMDRKRLADQTNANMTAAINSLPTERSIPDYTNPMTQARTEAIPDYEQLINKAKTAINFGDEAGAAKMVDLAKLMKPEEEKYTSMAPGHTLFSPKTGKPLFTAPFPSGEEGGKSMWIPIPYAGGISRMNRYTGDIVPLMVNGQPIIPIAADTGLAARKVEATETAKAGVEKRASFPKARNSLTSLENQWGNVDKYIDKAISQVSPFTAGVGSWTAAIPATPAKNLKEILATVQANIGFDKLADMRANSPSGGALGQVSDFENRLLQAVQGSLDQSQSPAQLIENLNNVKTLLKSVRAQKKQAFSQDYAEFLGQKNQAEIGNLQGNGNTRGKILDKATAEQFYKQAGGDPQKARQLARQAGYGGY